MIPYPWRARAVVMALAILSGVASYLLSGRTWLVPDGGGGASLPRSWPGS